MYLDSFYQFIKTKEAYKTFNEIETIVKDNPDNIEEQFQNISLKHNMSVLLTDTDLSFFTCYEYGGQSMLDMPITMFIYFYSVKSI